MSNKVLITILLAGMVGIIVLAFVRFSDSGSPISFGTSKAQACSKAQNDCMPDVRYIDIAGNAYTAENLNGKVVIVNFWATWCGPCLGEMPDLVRTYAQYKDKGVVLLGVMSDNPQPSDSFVQGFVSQHQMNYPIVRVTPDIFAAFGWPPNLPTTVVFNRAGKKVFEKVGQLTGTTLDDLLAKYTAEKS